MNRREFLAAGMASAMIASQGRASEETSATRGVVLYPFDLTLTDWPERAAEAGINTIALHAAQRFDVLHDFVVSDAGQKFLSRCRELGVEVEYELHALGQLLSRELYYKDPSLFRMDEQGRRNPDHNCNPFSQTALDLVAEQAVKWARIFRPTTHRYFYWPDDGAKWDASPEAAGMNASDQALIVENHILKALRRHVDPEASLAHISYQYTLPVPQQVRPENGVFLEFAPINRDYRFPVSDVQARTRRPHEQHPDPEFNGGYLEILEANMRLFGADQTQVLEYWLDVSMFSGWTRPAKKLPWDPAILRSDIETYRRLGVRHISSFATYIDAEYVRLHGNPQSVFNEYGQILRG